MSGARRSPLALAVMAPLREGHDAALLRTLAELPSGTQSAFGLIESTHVARWVLIPALLGPNGEPDQPSQAYLLFTAEIDGSLEQWTEAICARIRPTIDRVWQHCDDFPTQGDAAELLAYLSRHRVKAGFSITSYRAPVGEVRASLALRKRLRAFAVDGQGLSPAELRRAWHQAFGEDRGP